MSRSEKLLVIPRLRSNRGNPLLQGVTDCHGLSASLKASQ